MYINIFTYFLIIDIDTFLLSLIPVYLLSLGPFFGDQNHQSSPGGQSHQSCLGCAEALQTKVEMVELLKQCFFPVEFKYQIVSSICFLIIDI